MENLDWLLLSETYITSSISSTYSTKTSNDRFRNSLLLVFLMFSLSLTICMDVERNPGPTSTLANSRHSHLLDPPPTQFRYSNLFNTTKRIQLKLTRYNHHLLNYTFFKENNYIPPSLYPKKPPLHSDNQFNRKWKHISHQAAHKHLKLLIKECKNKINTLNMELSNHMELLLLGTFFIIRLETELDGLIARVSTQEKTHEENYTRPPFHSTPSQLQRYTSTRYCF